MYERAVKINVRAYAAAGFVVGLIVGLEIGIIIYA